MSLNVHPSMYVDLVFISGCPMAYSSRFIYSFFQVLIIVFFKPITVIIAYVRYEASVPH